MTEGIGTHVYAWQHWHKGKVIGEVHRYIDAAGEKQDTFCYNWNAKKKRWTGGECPIKPPYPLMGLESCQNLLAPVVVCEGQKARQCWEGLGFQAVSCMFGSKSAHLANWLPLSIYDVVIAPDDDEAGIGYAQAVFDQLTALDQPPKIWLMNQPKGKVKDDICDWVKLQPEMADWDELVPIHDLPVQPELAARARKMVAECNTEVPAAWKAAHEWPKPENIDRPLKQIYRLKPAMLPESIRNWCLDAADRMQCPLEYTAIGALVSIGAAIGCGAGIKPKRHDSDWVVYPNLWGVIAGPPGTKKSPALKEMMRPLQQLDSKADKEHKAQMNAFEAKKVAIESRVKLQKAAIETASRGRNKDEQAATEHELEETLNLENLEKPPCKRYVVNDATIEAMCLILKDNPRGVLLFQDELVGLLSSWDMEGKQRDRPFYLTLWNGGTPYTVDRATKDKPLRLESATTSILGCMQPDTMRSYLIDKATSLNDGLLQRFQLAVYLDAADLPKRPAVVDRKPDEAARFTASKAINELAGAEYGSMGARMETLAEGRIRHVFQFDDLAQDYFFQWLDDLGDDIDETDDPFIQQHYSKYDRLMPALALIFHVLDVAAGICAGGPVTIASAERAAAWCALLKYHAKRIYALAQGDNTRMLFLAQKIRSCELTSPFTVRELKRKGWRDLGPVEGIKKICDELSDYGWLRRQSKIREGAGRPTEFYYINPRLGVTANGGQIPS